MFWFLALQVPAALAAHLGLRWAPRPPAFAWLGPLLMGAGCVNLEAAMYAEQLHATALAERAPQLPGSPLELLNACTWALLVGLAALELLGPRVRRATLASVLLGGLAIVGLPLWALAELAVASRVQACLIPEPDHPLGWEAGIATMFAAGTAGLGALAWAVWFGVAVVFALRKH